MKVDILGVKIDNVSFEEAVNKVEGFIRDNRKYYVVTPNPEIVILAQKDHQLRQVLNSADLAIPDGVGLIYAAKFLGLKLTKRITGVDLMEKLCQLAEEKGFTVGLLGGRGDASFRAAKVLSHRFSKLNLRVFKDDVSSFVDILFVALGAPKQEKWIAKNLPKIPVNTAIGVGGAFEMIAGVQKRAPNFIQNFALEWLWRLTLEPWRMKRQVKLLRFAYLVIKQRFSFPSQSANL